MTNIRLSVAVMTLAAASMMNASTALAQSGVQQLQAPVPVGQVRRVATGSYFSPRLKARFVLQQMSIPGHSFWGARIVEMNIDSPLRQLNLQLGDVVTRLDGIRISDGRFQQRDFATGSLVWQIPQMENHYSLTQVRLIRSGQTFAQEGTVDLGPLHQQPRPICGTPGPFNPGGITP